MLAPLTLADTPARVAPRSATDARPLFKQYCYDCHGDGMDKGNLALDELLAVDGPGDKHAQWEKAWKIVLHE
ncbi:MAG TPA: hypothetical protein VFZ59_00875, partial [Verrucomicrobiae bacterium]|nr:hypothetical protein [Verrucomicrobiae bacterium]